MRRALLGHAFALAALVTVGCNESHGPGGVPSGVTACDAPSDCLVVPASCCGACGAATRADAIAVNAARASDYRASTCGDGFACPACFMEQDPRLVATCRAGQCAVVDLAGDPATACAVDSDCRVRTTDCCECGGATDPGHLVAVAASGEAAFAALACGDEPVACPECAPLYPPAYTAACVAGHCELGMVGP